jgi:octaprenyl-diphosphate synthase
MSLLDRERIQLITLQRKIGPALARFEQEFAEVTDGETPLTREICQHILRGKSKRFRPTLLLLSAQNGQEIDPEAITAAACVELVHTATLVHDDFIDAALTRRGLPSVNEAWGGAAALIMGDYLYSKALDILCRHGQHYAIELLAKTTLLMSQAEMMQLELKYDLATTEEQYLQVIYQKTASLIETACMIGAQFNPRTDSHLASFGRFGRKIGLVFQITDDIFDYLGDERRLGKPTGQDWEEGRITLPLIAALQAAPGPARDHLAEVAAARESETRAAGWPEVKAFVMEYGGVDSAFAMARQCGEAAKQALAPIASGTQKDLLNIAVEYVINRLN